MYLKKRLRVANYWHLKEDIKECLSRERKEEVKRHISKNALEKTLRYMRKAGYIRYVPLEDRWYFSGKASGTFRKLADKIEKYHKPEKDRRECKKIIHDFCFGL